MDAEIEFGDLEERRPDRALRPDRNAHYACVSLGAPSDADLPIYVDLDALLDMEDHAKSDTRVELGGVMLGGQFEDEEGKPFVIVTDTLRAQHYESTKGSFKFTHDTWAEISRRRDAYPAATQMVGWYHTHPDWGVFLSGMDLFICDHFFNKPLDVAYVIDPCRGHRGMFQWTQSADRKVRPTRGFFAIASRFRQNELAAYAALLEESAMSAELRRFPGASTSPSIVHAIGSKDATLLPILLLMMLMQFCLLAFLVWNSMAGPRAEDAQQLAALTQQVAQLKETIAANNSQAVSAELLDQVLVELKDAEPRTAQRLLEYARKTTALEEALLGHEAERKSLQRLSVKQDLVISDLEKSLADLRAASKEDQERLAALEGDLKDSASGQSLSWKAVFLSPWAWGGMFLAAFVGAGLAMVPQAVKQRQVAEAVAAEPPSPEVMES